MSFTNVTQYLEKLCPFLCFTHSILYKIFVTTIHYNILSFSAINLIIEGIYKSMNNLYKVVFINCDLSKAFDMVDHSVLLTQLEHYEIRYTALQTFKSYLENPSQFVKIRHTLIDEWFLL